MFIYMLIGFLKVIEKRTGHFIVILLYSDQMEPNVAKRNKM